MIYLDPDKHFDWSNSDIEKKLRPGFILNDVDELKNILSESLKQNDRLTYTQISEEYKISLKTLGKYKKMGLLVPVCKGGKSLLFDRLEVEEVLRTRPRIKPTFLKKAA